MSTEACVRPAESHGGPRSGAGRKRARAALDRVLWTATGIALGFGLAIVATFIYFAEVWL